MILKVLVFLIFSVTLTSAVKENLVVVDTDYDLIYNSLNSEMNDIILSTLALSSSSGGEPAPTAAPTPGPATVVDDKTTIPYISPSLKSQQVKKLKLSNNINVYIVNDSAFVRSAAALSVNIGSYNDDDNALGIAHFVEHLSFLGNAKYPTSGAFEGYLTRYNGVNNAWTSDEQTCYGFSLDSSGFLGALDRFSNMFVSPLFNVESVKSEINAVNQEYVGHLNDDGWKMNEAQKFAFGNPKHPYYRFSIGSLTTLGNLTSSAIRSWYNSHYSSHLMTVAVMSSLPMDKLVEQVTNMFSSIPQNLSNNRINISSFPPLNPDLQRSMLCVRPLHEEYKVDVMWALNNKLNEKSMLNTRPDRLISRILSYEGNGSLYSILKQLNIINQFDVGCSAVGLDWTLCSLTFQLNEAVTDSIVKIVLNHTFTAIGMIKRLIDTNQFPKYIFDDISHMDTLYHQYQERSEHVFDSAMSTAAAMLFEDLSTFPEKSNILNSYDLEQLSLFINSFTVETMFVTVMDRQYHFTKDMESNIRKEPYLKAEFVVTSIDKTWLTEFQSSLAGEQKDLLSKFSLRKANTLIPTDLRISDSGNDTPAQFPKMDPLTTIVDDSYNRIYYKYDNIFKMPLVVISVDVILGYFGQNTSSTVSSGGVHYSIAPRDALLFSLFTRTIQEWLCIQRIDIEDAGGSVSVSRSENYRLSIDILMYKHYGSMDGVQAALNLVVNALKLEFGSYLSESQFSVYKNTVIKRISNSSLRGPMSQSMSRVWEKLYLNNYDTADLSKEISSISYSDLLFFAQSIFKKGVLFSGLVAGQLTLAEATLVWTKSLAVFSNGVDYTNDVKTKTALVNMHYEHSKLRTLNSADGPFAVNVSLPSFINGSATVLAFQDMRPSIKAAIGLQILFTSISDLFYSVLRTKEQTGYAVRAMVAHRDARSLAVFVIESHRFNTSTVLNKISSFLSTILKNNQRSAEIGVREEQELKYNNVKQSMIENLSKQPVTFNQYIGKYLSLISHSDINYKVYEDHLTALSELTIDDIYILCYDFLNSMNRRGLVAGPLTRDIENTGSTLAPSPTTATSTCPRFNAAFSECPVTGEYYSHKEWVSVMTNLLSQHSDNDLSIANLDRDGVIVRGQDRAHDEYQLPIQPPVSTQTSTQSMTQTEADAAAQHTLFQHKTRIMADAVEYIDDPSLQLYLRSNYVRETTDDWGFVYDLNELTRVNCHRSSRRMDNNEDHSSVTLMTSSVAIASSIRRHRLVREHRDDFGSRLTGYGLCNVKLKHDRVVDRALDYDSMRRQRAY